MDEIPVATKCKTAVQTETKSVYEIQKSKCLDKIKEMLKDSKSHCHLTFNQPLEKELLSELESKEYGVKFTLTYDKVYICKLTIINPNVEMPKPEDQLTNLIDQFLNPEYSGNINKDFLTNIFRFQ